MNKFIAAGVTALALSVSPMALAADYSTPMMMTDPGFDWDGFYAGLGVSGAAWSNGLTVGTIDGVMGFNVTSDHILFGLEGTLGGAMDSIGGTGVQVAIDGRVGYLASPDAVLYFSGGGAYFSLPNQLFATVGGGAEFAINDSWTLDGEYEFWFNSTFTAHTFKASALYHF